jgi:hypothetical protein
MSFAMNIREATRLSVRVNKVNRTRKGAKRNA